MEFFGVSMKKFIATTIIVLISLAFFYSEKEMTTKELEQTCDVICGNHIDIMNEELERCYCYSNYEYREYKRK